MWIRTLPFSVVVLTASLLWGQTVPSASETPLAGNAGSVRLVMERFSLPSSNDERRTQATVVRRGAKLLLVVWTDGHGAGGHTGRPEKYGWEYSVTMRDANDRAVSWETTFVGGRFRSVKFHKGETYDRAAGRLIVLRTQGEKHEVRQFDVDLADYSPDAKGLEKLSQAEEVAEFMKKSSR